MIVKLKLLFDVTFRNISTASFVQIKAGSLHKLCFLFTNSGERFGQPQSGSITCLNK